MSTLRLNSDKTLVTEITVLETDEYTQCVYLTLDRHIIPEEIRGCSKMFLSVEDLERLGRFLVDQAEIIGVNQACRRLEKGRPASGR